MKYVYKSLLLFLGMAVMVFDSCTLDKDPEIPNGVTNETDPKFLSTDYLRSAQFSVSASAVLDTFGNLNILQHGWVWSKNPAPTLQDSILELGALMEDSFKTEISGLMPGKIYFLRPYVSTGSGTTYGQEKTINLIPTFKRTYDGSSGQCVQQTTDGGFILLGNYSDAGTQSYMYLVKTNAAGDVEWEKKFGVGTYGEGHSVQQTNDGGFILLGTIQPVGARDDMYLVKTNAVGDLEWAKAFGGAEFDFGYSVQQTNDGGFILLGYSEDGTDYSMYLIKTNMDGIAQWEQKFPGFNSSAIGVSVQQTSDGGFILLGDSQTTDSDVFYMVKTNALGEMQWEKIFGPAGLLSFAHSVQQTSDGGFILLGNTLSGFGGGSDMYLIKTNSLGELQWENIFGGFGYEYGNAVQQTTDGSFILLGTIEIEAGSNGDMYLVKTNASGALLWERTIGGPSTQEGNSVQQSLDGGYILLGNSYTPTGSNIYLVKSDENGQVY